MYIPTIIEKGPGGTEFHYDLYSRLLKDRIVMLPTEVNEEIAASIVGQLLFLDSENNDDITMYVNSPGGSVYDGLSIIDTMNMIKSDVKVICSGMAASMGAMILCSGKKGMRYATKSARIMIHSVSSGSRGTYHDLKIDFKETEFLQNYLTDMIVENTGAGKKQVIADMERDKWMSAEEALKYGLIDEII
jgi:ATP-dependent Clp protease protease subunit